MPDLTQLNISIVVLVSNLLSSFPGGKTYD